jgi:putative ABC transport system permease protein
MIAPRWSKVLKDLWGNKIRTVLAVLTIAVGVFAVGFVATGYEMIMHDMDADYQSVNPYSAQIFADFMSEDELNVLRRVPGVSYVEGRSVIGGTYLSPAGKKIIFNITAIPPIDQIKINRLRPYIPAQAPALGEQDIYIEKSALSALPVKVGDTVDIEIQEGFVRRLKVAGLVHEVTSIPYMFGQQVQAYVTPKTMEWLGGTTEFNQVILRVAERDKDEPHVREVAAAVADKIEASGRQVYYTLVFRPGRHFASDIINALGVMMGFFGLLAVFLSAFLVINTINALMGQHVRQIGVMKSFGARTFQLVVMYLALTLCLGILAFLLAAPAAIQLGYIGAAGFADYMNFQAGPFRIPVAAIILQLAVALLIPVGAAFLPVIKFTRITIREAISSYGLGQGHFGSSWIDRLVERIRGLPRPLLISLRNTFRRKARLALTLSSLVLAGSMFIAVFNLRASMNRVIDITLGYLLSDVNIGLVRSYRIQRLEPLVMSVPGVVGVESWGSAIGQVMTGDETTSTQVVLFGLPSDSKLIHPTLTAGRWLDPKDENGVVIGNHFKAVRPELGVGDEIVMELNGERRTWRIIGEYKIAGNFDPPLLYVNDAYLSKLLGEIGLASSLRVITDGHDLQTQQRIGDQVEAVLKQAGIRVANVQYGAEIVQLNRSTTDILVLFLLIMIALVAVVGGLGMMSTMSINVLERTREIGVLRAIGASSPAIFQLVLVEGIIIGWLSWVLGALLAVPIGMLLANLVGIAFFQSPMDFVFALDGFIAWMVVVAILGGLACFLPARSATRLTVREVLAYE